MRNLVDFNSDFRKFLDILSLYWHHFFNFNRKKYHGYLCEYKDVLKQYQIKYSETPLSHEYYEKKREHEEIKNRVLACTEQLKMNETIFMEFLGINVFIYCISNISLTGNENSIINQSKILLCFSVPAPFPSLTSWTLHMYPQ